jgi:hypothetical protein
MPPRADSYGTMAYTSPSINNADAADAADADANADDDYHVSNATTGNTTTSSSSSAAAGLSKDEFHNPYILKRTNSKYRYYVQIDDAIERIGIGTFQYSILFAAGLCFMADSMEVLLLSFLSVVLKHEWYLTEHQMDSIFAVVFAGALFGTLLLGPAGDIYGRKPIFTLTALIIAISGVVTAFCTNYTQLVIARFFVGFGVGGLTVRLGIVLFVTLFCFVLLRHHRCDCCCCCVSVDRQTLERTGVVLCCDVFREAQHSILMRLDWLCL